MNTYKFFVLFVLLMNSCGCGYLMKDVTRIEPGQSHVIKTELNTQPDITTSKQVTVTVLASGEDVDNKEPQKEIDLTIMGENVKVSSGSVLEIKTLVTDSRTGEKREIKTNADAASPGLYSTVSNLDSSQFNMSTPEIDLSDEGYIGSGSLDYMAKGLKKNSGPIILYAMGGIAMIAGVIVAVFIKRIVLGLSISAAGIAVISVATLFTNYPWVVLILFFVAIAIGIYFIFSANKTKRISDTLNTVVAGIESASEEEAIKIKKSIKKESIKMATKDVVKEEVSQIKKKKK